MSTPRITIITPSYEQADYLAECLESVATQQGAEVEHIVVDGGSTDGSRAIIERHASELHWWCSAPDKGQSDAINQGLEHATGQVFTWINSDDALLPGALGRVSKAFASDPHLLVYGGRLLHRDAQGDRIFERLNDVSDVAQLYRDPVINQPATFYRLDVVKEVGGVDPALRYVMDVELWWQVLFRYGIDHLRFEPVELAMFRMHDQSKTVTAHHGFLDELANLIHAMCLRSGAPELAHVLGLGHRIRNDLRGVPVEAHHQEIVRGIALYFLLKWHGAIHRKEQYRMMKALRRAVRAKDLVMLDDRMNDRWKQIGTQLRAPGWWTFRLRRKLGRLRR